MSSTLPMRRRREAEYRYSPSLTSRVEPFSANSVQQSVIISCRRFASTCICIASVLQMYLFTDSLYSGCSRKISMSMKYTP